MNTKIAVIMLVAWLAILAQALLEFQRQTTPTKEYEEFGVYFVE